MAYILFLISRSTSLFIMTFGRTLYAQLFNKFILPKLAACRFYVKRPKSASFFQVACSVIYSVTCFFFPSETFWLRKSSSFWSTPTASYWVLALVFTVWFSASPCSLPRHRRSVLRSGQHGFTWTTLSFWRKVVLSNRITLLSHSILTMTCSWDFRLFYCNSILSFNLPVQFFRR